jgi:hypothetical protein
MTVAEIKADCLDIIQDWQQHGDYTVAKLLHYINLGNREFVRRTKCIEGNIDITTVANQFEYDQSDAADLQYYLKAQQFRYIEETTEVGRKLDPFPGGYFNLPKDKIYGVPNYYWVRGVQGRSVTTAGTPTGSIIRLGIRVGTWPIISAGSETLRIEGYLYPAALTADSHVPEYDESFHTAIAHYAAYRILRMFSEKYPEVRQKSLEQKQEFETIVEEAKRSLLTNDYSLFQVPDMQEDLESW